jgi:hypothetical protein
MNSEWYNSTGQVLDLFFKSHWFEPQSKISWGSRKLTQTFILINNNNKNTDGLYNIKNWTCVPPHSLPSKLEEFQFLAIRIFTST